MMQGSDWPIPSATRPEAGRFEALGRALPAIAMSVALHGALAWWLLLRPEPWQARALRPPAAATLDVFFFTPPPPESSTAPASARVDAVPFPMSKPTVVQAREEVRAAPAAPVPAPEPIDSAKFFDDIAGVASGMTALDPQRTARSDTRIRDQDRQFIEAGIRFKPPPLTPEQVVNRVIGMVVATNAANSTTGLMGTIPGRDPGRELQAAHHDGLYLPRGCDDPENPNTSDECLGIPKH